MTPFTNSWNVSLFHETETDDLALISHAQYTVFLKINTGVSFVIAVVGIFCNVINIRTFLILGLNDGVRMSFFSLSVCDLIYLCIYLCLRIITFYSILDESGIVRYRIHPLVPMLFTANILYSFSAISMFSVTFLAVARCACVVMPLRFKSVFTPSRCLAFFALTFVLSVAAYVPVMTHTGTRCRFDHAYNATRIFVSFTEDRKKIKDVTYLFFSVIFPFVTQVITILCAILMTYHLRESARFRKTSAYVHGGDKERNVKLSSRDVRVISQVLVISVIYVTTSTPKVFVAVYGLLQPEFTLNKAYHYSYVMASAVRLLFEAINATVNFMIYYHFNSAFRAACFAWKSRKMTTPS